MGDNRERDLVHARVVQYPRVLAFSFPPLRSADVRVMLSSAGTRPPFGLPAVPPVDWALRDLLLSADEVCL